MSRSNVTSVKVVDAVNSNVVDQVSRKQTLATIVDAVKANAEDARTAVAEFKKVVDQVKLSVRVEEQVKRSATLADAVKL